MTGYDIEGKIVVITGGCSGLGKATALAFVQNGAKHVAVLDVQTNEQLQKDIENKYEETRLTCHKCDVTKEIEIDQSFEAIIADHGHIDVVMNFAAILNDEAYVKEIEINFTATVTMTQKALFHMRIDNGGFGGTIINISSVGALNSTTNIEGDGMPLPVYCATKIAVLHFGNCLASKTTWDRTGVRIMTVLFGTTETPMLMQEKLGYFTDYLREQFENNITELLVLQKPEEAIKAVVEAYKTGDHGSTWLSSSNKPQQDITEKIRQAYRIMWSCI